MKIAHNYTGKVAVITGGGGALGGAMALGLALEGITVILLGRTQQSLEEQAKKIGNLGGQAVGMVADVLDKESLETVKEEILERFHKIDILVNAAGGNIKGAVIQPEESVFDMDMADFDKVVDLNLKGSLLPTLVFGKEMSKNAHANIINISSIAAQETLTRVLGYSASKAAIENTTKWLAVEFAKKYENPIRVNAIAPGFFIGEQNRNLLLNADGSLTERGATIIQNTPMGRFGKPEELISSLLYLVSDASSFITGTVLYVDGGFKTFSGV
ncbi:SDR family oxidoreductase [Mangrovimonas sp. CR14]|uniref:SDR family oxidoreductase n=1 Tax=Mangrovimonas sp. CR14 TaxID=2706120 RepID=UPI0014244325|nr:SDR family oxidoreductase [Mangrovimonas sp. CR14]NIK91565.1 SDR family oxidoreductase [Mangrovimonas sp. CR14]